MKTNRILLMAAVAGAACSCAMAQSAADKTRPAPNKPVAAQTKASVEQRNVVYVEPISVRVNGVEVPFSVGEPSGDAATVVYDNIPVPANPFTFTNGGQAVLDDITLATSGGVRITGVRPSFGTGQVVNLPTSNMSVGVIWYNTLDPNAPAGTSVASNPQSQFLEVLVTFGAPQGGWLPGNAYTSTGYIFFPNNITTSNSGAVEVLMLDAAGSFFNPDFTPVYDGPVQIGSSQNLAWIDANLDGIYEATEAVQATAPDEANLRIALHAEIADPTAGRCCLSDGSCIVVNQTQCATLAGVFGGAGTSCVGNTCAPAPVLWNNGPIKTGATSISGFPAPAGTQWSEAVRQDNCIITLAGAGANAFAVNPLRLADDFTVPSGATWNLQNITVYAYQTNSTPTTSPFNFLTMRIWDGVPGEPGSNVVFGDDFTDLYPQSTVTFSGAYRIFNTLGATTAPPSNRPVWQMQVPVNATLSAGTYYVDYNVGGASVFVPPVSPMVNGQGVYAIEGANAKQFFGGTFNVWSDVGVSGTAAPGTGATGCIASSIEVPFIVRGTSTGGGCYANCDGSTGTPVLNVADFGCFLTKFASGDPYANCDGSTGTPILNVADFGCFLTKFATGCN